MAKKKKVPQRRKSSDRLASLNQQVRDELQKLAKAAGKDVDIKLPKSLERTRGTHTYIPLSEKGRESSSFPFHKKSVQKKGTGTASDRAMAKAKKAKKKSSGGGGGEFWDGN